MKIKINLESWNLAKISPIECTWKFQSNFIHISCYQLSTAVNSWWQLITVDENWNQLRELKFGTSIKIRLYIKISVEFFSYQLSSAVNSGQQLITVDENENQPRKLKFGTSINFSVYMQIPVELFSYQLSSAVNSYSVKPILAELSKNTQLIWVELSLAWSGFNSHQLLKVADNCWQLLKADHGCHKNKWIFYLHPIYDICTTFELSIFIFIFISW